MNMLKRLWKEEEGQGLSEYGLLLAGVVLVVVLAVGLLGDEIEALFQNILPTITLP